MTGPSSEDPEDRELRVRVKRVLRQQMRAVRNALPVAAREARSQRIAERVVELPEFEAARTVVAFASTGSEVQTRAVIESVWSRDRKLALPRVTGDALSLREVTPQTELQPGAFGVVEPPEDSPSVKPLDVDFALVPALAVDPRGFRLGYGRGFYDRLLPLLEGACTCVVAYDFQLLAEIPELPFDASVDLIVTDERVIRTE